MHTEETMKEPLNQMEHLSKNIKNESERLSNYILSLRDRYNEVCRERDSSIQENERLKKEIEDQEIDLDNYDDFKCQGIEIIYLSQTTGKQNLLDQQTMELFCELVNKHGIKKVLDWLIAIKSKFGA
jgi:hypothetical protein